MREALAQQIGDAIVYISFYLTPALVLFGMLGNFLAFVIFRRGMRRSASHFYFCVLSVADTCTLISVFLVGAWFRIYLPKWMALEGIVPGVGEDEQDERNVTVSRSHAIIAVIHVLHTSPGCSIWYFVRLTSQTASVWLLVAFTFTRLMVIRHPLSALRYSTVSGARIMVLVVVAMSALLNVGVAVHDDCNRRMTLHFDEIIELAFISFVPALLLLAMNCLILVTVYRRQRLIRGLRSVALLPATRLEAEKHRLSGITQRLLAVSIAFILLEAPTFIFHVYTMVHKDMRNQLNTAWDTIDAALRILSIINFSVNFILYCLTGKQFRNALLSTLRCHNLNSVLSYVHKPVGPKPAAQRRAKSTESKGNKLAYLATVMKRRIHDQRFGSHHHLVLATCEDSACRLRAERKSI